VVGRVRNPLRNRWPAGQRGEGSRRTNSFGHWRNSSVPGGCRRFHGWMVEVGTSTSRGGPTRVDWRPAHPRSGARVPLLHGQSADLLFNRDPLGPRCSCLVILSRQEHGRAKKTFTPLPMVRHVGQRAVRLFSQSFDIFTLIISFLKGFFCCCCEERWEHEQRGQHGRTHGGR